MGGHAERRSKKEKIVTLAFLVIVTSVCVFFGINISIFFIFQKN